MCGDEPVAATTASASVSSEGILAVIGAVTGPAGIIVALLTYFRDAVHIRVRLQRGYRVTQLALDDAVRDALEEHREMGIPPPMALYAQDPDKKWAYINVSNRGRRTVIIEKIGWVTAEGEMVVPGGFMADDDWLPMTLTEGDGKEYPVEEGQVARALAVFATDRTGRRYLGSYARSFGGFRVWLLRLLRLKYR